MIKELLEIIGYALFPVVFVIVIVEVVRFFALYKLALDKDKKEKKE